METKEAQKNLLTEIMDADAKDGLYKQQTAVEYINEYIKNNLFIDNDLLQVFEEAKEIEKEKIIKAYEAGWVNGDLKKAPRFGKDYYNNLYK
jgi:hypothetical protein